MQLRDDVLAKRELVANTINEHLAKGGHAARVDHRSLKQQGIDRKPERRVPKFRIDEMSEQEKARYVAARKKMKRS